MIDCVFCNQISDEQILYQTKHFKLVFDIDPIQTGHLLLISKEHYTSLGELPPQLLHELIETQAHLLSLLEEALPIDGVTIASNDKNLMDAGTHFHVHLIPRVREDGFWDQISLEQQHFSLETFLDMLKR